MKSVLFLLFALSAPACVLAKPVEAYATRVKGWTAHVKQSATCNSEYARECDIPTTLTLHHGKHKQTFHTEAALINSQGSIDKDAFALQDFNFDGKLDFALLSSGHDNAQGFAAYDIYLQNQQGRLVKNEKFTELATGYQGLPELNPKRRTLTVAVKSGCCAVTIETYRVYGKAKLQLIEIERELWEMIDENSDRTTLYILRKGRLQRVKIQIVENINNEYSRTTTKILRNGRWHKSVRTMKME